jgi:hypothetical protein
MKYSKQIFAILVFIGIVGIQLTPLVDDPAHFFTKDPDCPLCLAFETPLSIETNPNFEFIPSITCFVSDNLLNKIDAFFYFSSLYSRAPPEHIILFNTI